MLVKQSIVEKWYQRDSWVYKNFAYLFQNPLWNKAIPGGFSVCPYFWLNLFSFFIFRPLFVAPIKYLIIPIIKAIGRPAHVVDEWMYNQLQKVGFGPPRYHTGAGILLGTLSAICVAGITFLLYVLGYKTYHYYNSLDGVYTSLYWFWTVASLLPMFIGMVIHKIQRTTDCKPGYYPVGWLVLFVISLFVFIPSQTIHALGVAFFATTHGIGQFISLCWTGAIFGLGVAFSFLWEAFKAVFSWKPFSILMLPWWCFIIAFTVFMWVLDRVMIWWDNRMIQTWREANPEQLYVRFRMAWLDLFVRICLHHKRWKNGEIFEDEFDTYTAKAVNAMKYGLIRRTFEEMWKTELNTLQKDYPFLKDNGWKAIANADGTNARFSYLKDFLEKKEVSDAFPYMNTSEFFNTMRNIVLKDAEVKKLVEQYKADDEWRAKQKEAKKTSWAHVTCIKVTHAIADGFHATVHGIWNSICWVCSNIGTFCAYMWMLIKAKKQGACPYFRFTDPSPKQ